MSRLQSQVSELVKQGKYKKAGKLVDKYRFRFAKKKHIR